MVHAVAEAAWSLATDTQALSYVSGVPDQDEVASRLLQGLEQPGSARAHAGACLCTMHVLLLSRCLSSAWRSRC